MQTRAGDLGEAKLLQQLERGWDGALPGLAPGRYRFKVFPDDVAIEPEVVDMPAEDVVEVRWWQRP